MRRLPARSEPVDSPPVAAHSRGAERRDVAGRDGYYRLSVRPHHASSSNGVRLIARAMVRSYIKACGLPIRVELIHFDVGAAPLKEFKAEVERLHALRETEHSDDPDAPVRHRRSPSWVPLGAQPVLPRRRSRARSCTSWRSMWTGCTAASTSRRARPTTLCCWTTSRASAPATRYAFRCTVR